MPSTPHKSAATDEGSRRPNSKAAANGLLLLATFLMLLWPLFLNGRPFYFFDSAPYLRGGAMAWNAAVSSLSGLLETGGGHPNVSIEQTAVIKAAAAGGVRSIVYSVLAFVLRAPGSTLILLALFQCALVAALLTGLKGLVAPEARVLPSLAVLAGVAAFTSVSWWAAFMVPDIFSAVGVLGAAVLTIFFERIGIWCRMALVLAIALSITVHASHLLIVTAALLTGAVARYFLNRPSIREMGRKGLWFAAPVVLAVGALLATSYIGFREVSLTPKRYPILLVRSIDDGPGRKYLEEHCAIRRYAVCEVYGANIPRGVEDLLWGSRGLRWARPEQIERIRAEETEIVFGAAAEYPTEQIRSSMRNFGEQLVSFDLDDIIFHQRMAGGGRDVIPPPRTSRPTILRLSEIATRTSVALGLVLLALMRRRLTHTEIALLTVVVVGLLVNAATCGMLSAVAGRYQGRIVWILPALSGLIMLRQWSGGSSRGVSPSPADT